MYRIPILNNNADRSKKYLEMYFNIIKQELHINKN